MRKLGSLSVCAVLLGGAAFLALVACQNYGQPKSVADASEAIPDRPDYNWDVRPILSQNCFQCHGNDGNNRKAGLRLDMADAAYGKLPEDPGKHAIVPGNPKKSELFRRITSTDADYRMPPREAHKTVSARDVAVIERWIKQGAKYQNHWAYLPVKEVKPARTEWDKKAVNQIDRYIYAKLKTSGLSPSAEADRETLINRVSLDLTGLPPTLAEVDAFVADKRPDAYEHLVDRLLSSTDYAERQANIWMDVARYADSDGFLNDGFGRFQHPYRDWVISAFRRNLPYDKFVTWQIAGDKLPNPTREQVLATAFARAGKKSNEAGIIDEEYRVEYVNERAELVGKAFLGLTVGCAKCHDHKYDVISQADYYSMGGFFNSVDERGIASGAGSGPTLAWPSPSQAKALTGAQQAVAARQRDRDAALRDARQRLIPTVDAAIARGAVGSTVTQALAQAQQAYYPMESAYRASLEPLSIANYSPSRRDPDGGGGAAGGGRTRGSTSKVTVAFAGTARPGNAAAGKVTTAPGDTPRLAVNEIQRAVAKALAAGKATAGTTALPASQKYLVGISEEKLVWTPDPTNPKAPGAINNLHVIDGPPGRGKAILIDDTIAFANKNVGNFERTQPFSLDIWVKLRTDKPYDQNNILYNADRGGAGYELMLNANVLHFGVQNVQPYNMIEVAMLQPLPKGKWVHLTATYDGSSRAAGAKLYVDGKLATTEVLHDRLNRTIRPRGGTNSFGSYTGLSFGREFGAAEFNKGGVDELRVFTRSLSPLEVAWLHDPKTAIAVDREAARHDLLAIAVASDARVVAAEAALRSARESEQAVNTAIPQLAVLGDRSKPRTTYLHERGNYDQLGKEVPVQALDRVFKWDASYPRTRLGLAQWLFNPKNPMTARVYVNRLWQSHFGTGIVETVEDFGTQGSNPTHPQLLDYLTAEFIRSGWDIRHMHKLMVMSATYRQSSTITPDRLEKDPRNFLLARGPRYRLPAETIRDSALFASGLLQRTPGGDSVFPYQPQGVWDATGVGPQVYPDDVPADENHRRSLYTFIKRNAQFPSLAVFDFADRNVSTVTRKISNTPLQALVLLNDPQYREAYRSLAERSVTLGSNPNQRITALFRLATRRHPSAKEQVGLERFYASQLAHMRASPLDAAKTIAIGVAPPKAGLDQAEVAAMTMVAAAVMNSPDAYSLR